MPLLVPSIAQDGPSNVANAGIMHLGKRGPGSQAACGSRAAMTFGKDRFIALGEGRCARCVQALEKSDRVKEKRAGLGNDSTKRAAGIAFIDPNSNALFVKRVETAPDYPGYWTFPGGELEGAEIPEAAARREATEELGTGLPDGALRVLDRQRGDVDYTTFVQHAQEQFTPTLNDENSEYVWAPLGKPPWPLHPGVKTLLTAGYALQGAMDAAMAFDRASVRRLDKDGRLHIEITNISKANICPYIGKEIPGYKALGLDPDKIYQMYRDPEELAKGAATFNNLPVLSEHIPVTAWDHRPDLVIGSTGTDAVFEAPFLRNSMVFWVMDEILQIEDQSKEEISSAYRYRADMTPGDIDGVMFDGVMRDIIGNHVALVPDGRAGDDVVVGDSKKELTAMAKKTKKMMVTAVGLSPLALVAKGMLMTAIAPLLAQDAAIDFDPVLKGVTKKNFKTEKPKLFKRLEKACDGKLAQDASLDAVMGLLDAVEQVEQPDAIDAVPVDGPAMQPPGMMAGLDAETSNFLKSKMSEDDCATFDEMFKKASDKAMDADKDKDDDAPAKDADKKDDPAEDADEDDKEKKVAKDADDDKVTKPAMDAAIGTAVKTTEKRMRDEQRAMRVAETEVRAKIGDFDVLAFDSAEAIYRHGLELLGVEEFETVAASALPVLLKHQPGLGTTKDKKPALAMDARQRTSFAERFPGAARIGHAT